MLEWWDALFWDGYTMRDGTCCGAAWAHTFERMAIHLACSSGLTLLSLTLWNELATRGLLWRLRGYSLFVTPLAISLLLIQAREAFDAAAGDSPIKSLLDVYPGWAAGCILSFVGLWRLSPRIDEARKTVSAQRQAMWERRLRP